jgi:hypothetical protein
MEQRPPLGFIPGAVPLDQLEHGVLNEIERLIVVSCGQLRHAERATFDSG